MKTPEESALSELRDAAGVVLAMAIVYVDGDLSEDETVVAIKRHIASLPCMKGRFVGAEFYRETILLAADIVEGRVKI